MTYTHIGADTVIFDGDIVGIFDLDTTTVSKNTRAFLKDAQTGGRVREVTSELPRSFVLCDRGGDTRVYLSQLSPATLKKRLETIDR